MWLSPVWVPGSFTIKWPTSGHSTSKSIFNPHSLLANKANHSFCITDCYAQMNVLIHSWRVVSVPTKLSKDFLTLWSQVITSVNCKTYRSIGGKNCAHCRVRPRSPHGHRANKHFIMMDDYSPQSICKSFRLHHYSLQIV